MLISVLPASLLICEDWRIVKEIKDPNIANTSKYWMSPLPGFHTSSWPFILIAGRQTINVLNVSTHTMQVLVNAKTGYMHAQQGTFFTTEDNKIILNFAKFHFNEENKRF